jgi:hypothetical protein
MSTLSSVPRLSGRSLVLWPLFAACGVLIIAAILVPDLHRPKVVPSTPKAETKTTAKFAAPTQLEMGATTGRMALAAEPRHKQQVPLPPSIARSCVQDRCRHW